ncbi:MAG: grasp-with-spasm system SPASM domain peptide maturase [Bacteroidales bacterium]|jgi:SPASM domain peptide maturase of grasp-with-spasm system|nr:grasp-with-spasm system SPASM domain peptide maturase [Bacteroidales bacterium]MDN5351057.1 hypothetical protein [Bacteroidales bacterium]
MNNHYFNLYSNCIPIAGRNRAIIYDLQFHRYKIIPKLLYSILLKQGVIVSEIKKCYQYKYDKGIDSYFNKLVDEEFGFYTDGSDVFPKIDFGWEYPALITNAVIDIDIASKFDYQFIFNELQACNCDTIQLRFYFAPALNQLNKILQLLDDSKIKGIEICVPFSRDFSESKILALTEEHKRLRKILFHNWQSNETFIIKDVVLYFVTKKIDYIKDCGYISYTNFYPSMKLFTEALHYNTCLNKKVSINTKGDIMNCPSLNKSFGNIKSCSIVDIIKTQEFQRLWSLSKDKITTCKQCEYRYMCSDCRAFRESKSLYSKPSKCQYNP